MIRPRDLRFLGPFDTESILAITFKGINELATDGIGRWQCSHITRTILVEGSFSVEHASIMACKLLP